jgi:all-trans-retinol dehydrogenase (NAD+)
MTDFADKVVLVTGGAAGIGRLVAHKAAARGAHVVVWDLDGERLEEVVAEITREGGSASGFTCDVADREAVCDVADCTRTQHGDVDVLFNNAGVVSGAPLLEIDDQKIERTITVNVLAPFWVTRAFLPAMVARNAGHIVTMASAAGLIGVARLSDYSASKFAAVGFNEALRMELRRLAPRVRTTVVCPYFIDTGMFAGVRTRVPALLPILKENDVAARIVEAVERDRHRVLMPPMVKLVPVLRALPVPLFDAIADLFGINASMDRFVGRTPAPDAQPTAAAATRPPRARKAGRAG